MKDFSLKAAGQVPDFALSEESKAVIKRILDSKTAENNGVIDINELGSCLEAFGLHADDEDIQFLEEHFDDNGDGELEVKELVENLDVLNWHCFYGKELMREFRKIDTDGDRFIRYPEMLRVLTTRGPTPLGAKEGRQLLDQLARKFDENFDGKFSYSEFVKIYMSDMLPFKDLLEGDRSVGTPEPDQTEAHQATQANDKKKKVAMKKRPSNISTTSTKNGKTQTASASVDAKSDSLQPRRKSDIGERSPNVQKKSPDGGAQAATAMASSTRVRPSAERSTSDGKVTEPGAKVTRPKLRKTTSTGPKHDVTRGTAASRNRANLFKPI